MKKFLIAIPALLLTLASCDTIYHDTLPCEAAVAIDVYVEGFAGDLGAAYAPGKRVADREPVFGERIEMLNYYLYRDGVLFEFGPVNDPSSISGPVWTFSRDNLDYGDYKLVLLGNCAEELLQGSKLDPNEMIINYPGSDDTEDYFVDSYDFTVQSTDAQHNQTLLKRVHGVVRYTFNNISPRITAIEVTMDGLSGSSCVTGVYSEDYTFTKRIDVNRRRGASSSPDAIDDILPNDPTIVGNFPTTEGGVSTWSVKLFDNESDEPIFEKQISDNVSVLRNDLLDLSAQFEGDKVSFYIGVDLVWSGSIDGGTTII